MTLTGDLFLSQDKRIQFDSVDTFIKADTGASENLELHADDAIYFKPDGMLYQEIDHVNVPMNMCQNFSSIIFTPADFVGNDDQSYYNYAIMDSGAQGKVMHQNLEAYAMTRIPQGRICIEVTLYGSVGTFYVYKSAIDSASGSGIGNASVNSTLGGLTVSTAEDEYIIIK